ncbi:MAG: DUF4232 domain-containing protein [Brevundimonas sp.]|uniref:DUF4232 domain-containing protein n=1 Tax=Brevundimonas sp. TaxID=1871086 RepID=UPI0012289A6C|nr:DUF4232 domain-containing protein [Brevundimonas sp.]RZJ19675.1 MAG: DUF4232 domain-containing protein [Brevundimonas sp.]
MIASPVRAAAATMAIAALMAACSPPADEPVPAPEPYVTPVPTTADSQAVSYACESGRTVAVRYPDARSAVLTYDGRAVTLKTATSASGARYAGEGLEWWTANRDGQETATLRRLGPNQDVGVAVLERCARPASSPAQPLPGPGTPTPAPGSVMPVSAPCKGGQLRLTNEGGDAGMGNRVAVLGIQNTGAQPCSLTGYPTVTLLDSKGQALAVRADQNPGNYFHSNTAPEPVELRPQTRAYFDLAWNVVPHEGQGETICPSTARVRLTVPGDAAPVSLAQTFTPCGGRVRVSPFRPVEADTPPSAAL